LRDRQKQVINWKPEMDYSITLIPKGQYVHAIVTGRNSLVNVVAVAVLDELLHQVPELGTAYVLVEDRLEGPRLTMTELFEAASIASERSLGSGLSAMAYVDTQAKEDMMKFAELVATNRSMPIRVFTSMDEAEIWLAGVASAEGAE
jgi:hypothetical protein